MPKTIIASVAIVIGLATPTRAEIFPTQTTLTYSESSPDVQTLAIEATDGKRFELTLRPSPNAGYFDLVMLPADAPENTRNLLEPRLRTWHGYQQFMLAASDYVDGPGRSTYGPTRNFILNKERIGLTVSISKVSVKKIANAPKERSYLFEELALEIHASNLK